MLERVHPSATVIRAHAAGADPAKGQAVLGDVEQRAVDRDAARRRAVEDPALHRGAIGENVPGYGLGLNLARELARLHQGDLQLVRSGGDWTEFEVRFRLASTVPSP